MTKSTTKFPFDEVDDFQLRELIYEGPHTLVFRGFQSNLNRSVLIKLLKPSIKERKEWIERFQREARVCAQLKHPNIVSVFKLGEKDGYHYIALEFVEGISLKELLAKTAPLPVEVSLSLTDQILEAFIYVHQHNIIHRDIKPGNILIDTQGRAKLTDFGLAHLGDEVSVTVQGSIIGTPAYMAPEQIMGGALDGKTDLFSLGTVVYEMLTGKQAFGGESYSACLHKIINEQPPSPTGLNRELPGGADSFIEKFLKKDPQERWADAQQAQANLHRLAAEHRISLKQASIQEFIPPFVSSASTEEKSSAAPIDREQSRQKVRNGAGSIFSGRWILAGGLAAALILVLAIFFRNKAEDDSAPAAGQEAISLLNDSAAVETPHKTENRSGSGIAEDTTSVGLTPSGTANSQENPIGEQVAPQQETARKQTPAADSPLAEHTIDEPFPNDALIAVENATVAQLTITVEPWAEILVDDQAVDSQDVGSGYFADQVNQTRLSLRPGRHTLTFVHPNFSPYSMQVEIQPGEEKTVHWSFLKNAGFLWVEVRPWAEVHIDNQYRDSTPLEKPIALSPGKHLLELKHPRLSSYRDFVAVQPGDTLRLQVVLKE